MRLVVKGDERASEQTKSPKEFAKITDGHKKGFFKYASAWSPGEHGVLTITFTPIIYIEEGVKGSELQDVKRHEQRHYADFKHLAAALRQNMGSWLHSRKSAEEDEIQAWLTWLDYDYCVASANFHRSIDANVELCLQPSTPRPK
jgi:hypothetical protein